MSIDSNSAPAKSRSQEPIITPQSSGITFHVDPINILIVDDEPKNLTVLETILEDSHYRLVKATSVDQALQALLVEEYALLILDIQMPEMTGFELARIIRSRKKTAHLPIIFLTAYYNDDQDVLNGYGTGAVDYLFKPVKPAILRSKVAVFSDLYTKSRALLAEVVERRRAEEQLLIARTQAEQALHRTLKFDETVMRNMSEGLYTVDVHGLVTSMNPAAERLLGWTLDEVRGRKMHDVIHYKHRDGTPFKGEDCAGLKVLREDMVLTDYEDVFLRKDGTFFDVSYSASTLCENDETIGLVIVFRDITDRKQAESALRESEARYRETFANAAVGIALVALDGRWLRVNDAVCRITGYGREELLMKPFADITHPDDLDLEWANARRLLTGEATTYSMEKRYLCKEGGITWIHLTVSVQRDESGSPNNFICIIEDITERKMAEERLCASERLMRAIFNQQFAFCALLSAEGQILQFSESVYRNNAGTDIDPKDLIGGNFLQAPWWRDLPDTVAEWRRQFSEASSQRGPAPGEAPYQLGNGSLRYAINTVTALRDDRGNIEYLLCEGMDITELKQAQSRLESFAEDLERQVTIRTAELVETQGRLRALSAELSLAEYRERKRMAAELHDYLQQLLVFGKMQVGQGKKFALGVPGCETVMKQLDVLLSEALTYTHTLVSELSPPVLHEHGLSAGLKWLGEYMKKYGFVVTVTVPDHSKVKLPEDQLIILFQSVRELLINSYKHAGIGHATLTMTQAEGRLQIHVQDDGKGFYPPGDDYAQTRDELSSKFGLFSIRERMRALGGWFDIQSEPEKGTFATLSIPVQDESLDIAPEPIAVLPMLPGQPRQGRTERAIRVLLVDDHAMVRQGLRSILTGYSDLEIAGESANGIEALSAVEEHRPAVVVMDINMPKMDGIEATKRIKARYPDVSIIGLSVNAGSENQQTMLQAGAVMLLTKEDAVDQLYSAIQEVIKGKSEKSRIQGGEAEEQYFVNSTRLHCAYTKASLEGRL